MNIIRDKKPLSANELWCAPKRFRTAKYNRFIKEITAHAMPLREKYSWIKTKRKKNGDKDIKNSARGIFVLTFASSNVGRYIREMDVDNACKGIIDSLSKTLDFNDKVLRSTDPIKLEVSEFGCEFIAWEMVQVHDLSLAGITQAKKDLLDLSEKNITQSLQLRRLTPVS